MTKSLLLPSLPTATPCIILWILPAPPHPISFLLQTQIPNPLSLALSFSSPSCLPQKSFSLYGHIVFSFTAPPGCRRTMKHPPGPPWAMLSWAVLPWGSQIHHLQAACRWLGTSCLVKVRMFLLSILNHTPTLAMSNRVGREESVTAHSEGAWRSCAVGTLGQMARELVGHTMPSASFWSQCTNTLQKSLNTRWRADRLKLAVLMAGLKIPPQEFRLHGITIGTSDFQ